MVGGFAWQCVDEFTQCRCGGNAHPNQRGALTVPPEIGIRSCSRPLCSAVVESAMARSTEVISESTRAGLRCHFGNAGGNLVDGALPNVPGGA